MRLTADGKPTYERQSDDDFTPYLGWNPASLEMIHPPQSKRIPKDGAWAMIVRALPPVERQMDRKVRVGMVFYIQHQDNTDEFGFTPDGYYKVLCRTPWGDPMLWPYEYSPIKPETLLELWDGKEMVFHPIAENIRFTDALFYIRSRGIALADAMVMALGSFKGPVGYFEPTPELQGACERMAGRVHKWKPRRKSKEPMNIVIEDGQQKIEAELDGRPPDSAARAEAKSILFGGKLSEIPKPWHRQFPGPQKRKVRLTIGVFTGVGRHFHVRIEEEDNPIYCAHRDKYTTEAHWHKAEDDKEANGRAFDDKFDTEKAARQWARETFAKQFGDATHQIVQSGTGEPPRWFYREGD